LEDLPRTVVRLIDQTSHLFVDDPRGVGRHLRSFAGEQRPAIARTEPVLAEGERTELGAHAELDHHGPGDLGGPLQVVRRAGGDLLVNDLFGRSAPQREGQAVE
jgi:hypothetical protein